MWKRLLLILAVLLLVRQGLFHTEAAWRFYHQHLRPKDIGDTGFREHEFLGLQAEHYALPDNFPGAPTLAVGSSQVHWLFSQYSEKHPETLRRISLAGMGPIDLVLFRPLVEAYKPARILLYLSELDMTNSYYRPYLANFRISPGQGFEIFSLYGEMRRFDLWEHPMKALSQLLTLELFPEIRYNYIPKAFVDRALGRAGSRTANLFGELERMTPEEVMAWQDGLYDHFTEDAIPFNRRMLELFLAWCGGQGYEVVILEGQIKPDVPGERLLRLHDLAAETVRDLSESFPHARFIPLCDLPPLEACDYFDHFHMNLDAGGRFTTRLLQTLDGAEGTD